MIDLLQWLLVAIVPLLAALAAGHALLTKHDPRTALGWIAVCVMFPLAGPMLYYLFGINRVRTRARHLESMSPFRISAEERAGEDARVRPDNDAVAPGYDTLVHVSDAVTRRPLVRGNRLEMLENGERAYPAMLRAIEAARDRVFLSSYIFETDAIGRRFVQTLGRAAARGVDVKVVVDGFGELYSFPLASRMLRRQGVRTARFLPPKLLPPTVHVNLRNHRKILVVDGHTAFTGGMNIGGRHLVARRRRRRRTADVHFRLQGPVVRQIETAFLEDWRFLTGEDLLPAAADAPEGTALCRAVADGPNEELDQIETILIGAVSVARRRIAVMTPYFLPSAALIAALQSAALRGVEVAIVLPERNNLPYMHWATRKLLGPLLVRGVRVWYQPPPFVHAKLLLVDDYYLHIGSANIDARSLRLNFELIVEVFDEELAGAVLAYVSRARAAGRELSAEELGARPLPEKLRDAAAWLFSPYL